MGTQVNALAFAANGNTLAAALHDGRAALWQAAGDAELRQADEWQRGP